MASFLTNPPPGPRLYSWVQVGSLEHLAANGYVDASARANLDAWLATNLDPFLDAGGRYAVFANPYGVLEFGYTVGMYPLSLSATGQTLACSPLVRRLHENAIIANNVDATGTEFTDQIVPAFNTAARKGRMHELVFYQGAYPVSFSPTDTVEMDYNSAIERSLGAVPCFDVHNDIDFANDICTPTAHGDALVGWWSGDSLSTTPVTTWADRSGLSHDWSATPGNKPVLLTADVNGRNAVDFNGTSSFMTLASAMTLADYTIQGVLNTDTAADMFLLSRQGVNRQIRLNEGAGTVSTFDGAVVTITATGTWVSGAYRTLTIKDSGTAWSVAVNGAAATLVGGTSGSGMSVDELGAFASGGPSNFFDGKFAEICVANAAGSANVTAMVDRYLAQKYGLTTVSTATLPHKAHVQRLVNTHGVRVYGENYAPLDASLAGWFALTSGVMAGSPNVLDTIAAPGSWYTRQAWQNAGKRAGVFFNGATLKATRVAHVYYWTSRGYDLWQEMRDFSAGELARAVADAAAGAAAFLNLGGWRARGRTRHR